MILNTGSRTDIPAYYSEWFYNRIREGYVLARNPYYPAQVTRYRLAPDVIDAIAAENDLQIRLCCESADLTGPHVDADGCLSQKVLEEALGCRLIVPKKKGARQECACLLGADIGAYNTCGHGCLYCYANYDKKTVRQNRARHDKKSPFLIGGFQEGDIIKDAKQASWRDPQINLFDLMC